uniref:Putative group i salivary lipocalin n=1 Tax=Rhipicephalus pulchellus TaxID=72859 RepID=L7LQA4_RHIPC
MFPGLVLAFVLAVSLSNVETAAKRGNAASNVDIKKFYSTNETSWTYNTTKHTSYDCVRDVTNNITDVNVTYTRFSTLGGSPRYSLLKGVFVRNLTEESRIATGLYNAMDVLDEDGDFWWRERLEYATNDYSCGVFSVMIPTRNRVKTSYDLRLKNSAVQSTLDQTCLERFKALSINSTVTQLYTSDCQKVLQTSPSASPQMIS